MNSTTRGEAFLTDLTQNSSITHINHMPFREFDVTIGSMPWQRYAGMGVTLEDVVDDLHTYWRSAIQEFSNGPDRPESEFLKGWPDFAVWQGRRLVALVLCPGDMLEPLRVVETAPLRDEAESMPPADGNPLLRTTHTLASPGAPDKAVTVQVLVIDSTSEVVASPFEDFPELREAGWIRHSVADLMAFVRIIG